MNCEDRDKLYDEYNYKVNNISVQGIICKAYKLGIEHANRDAKDREEKLIEAAFRAGRNLMSGHGVDIYQKAGLEELK